MEISETEVPSGFFEVNRFYQRKLVQYKYFMLE